jgi:hypothetical protein
LIYENIAADGSASFMEDNSTAPVTYRLAQATATFLKIRKSAPASVQFRDRVLSMANFRFPTLSFMEVIIPQIPSLRQILTEKLEIFGF